MSEPVALNPLRADSGDFQYTAANISPAAAIITTVDVSIDLATALADRVLGGMTGFWTKMVKIRRAQCKRFARTPS
jgi:hypothetical protein